MDKVHRTVLPSGLTVVVEPHAEVRSASVGLWIRVGSALESAKERGISHFVEHMLFKGTTRRNPFEIATALESVGGELNAFTDREATCIHATVLSENLPEALEIVADLALRPLFAEEQIQRERKVVCQEILSVEETPEERLSDFFFEKIWQGYSLSFPIQGSEKAVRRITGRQLQAFHKRHYRVPQMVLSVAGNVSSSEVLRLVRRFFAEAPRSKGPKGGRVATPRFHPGVWAVRQSSDQVYFLLGFEGVGYTSRYRFEALLAAQLLGGGMSSRLFQEVREKQGLAYSIDCDALSLRDTGILTIFAAVNRKAFLPCLESIGRELRRMGEERVSEQELKAVKGHVRGMLLLGAESMETRQEAIARQELAFTKQIPLRHILEGIERVTAQSLLRFCQKTLLEGREALVYLSERPFEVRKLRECLWKK